MTLTAQVAAGEPAKVLGLGGRGGQPEVVVELADAVVVQAGQRDRERLLRQIGDRARRG